MQPNARHSRPWMIRAMRLARQLAALPAAALWLAACSPVRTSEFQIEQQASDAITGTGGLAMTAVRATAVSTVRQPFTTARHGLAFAYYRPGASLDGIRPLPTRLAKPLDVAPGTPEFESLLDMRGLHAAQPGRLGWLVDGPEFFAELERKIAAATRSIDIQVFIFDNDDTGVRTADLLKARSSEVPVRVLFDDLGTTVAHTVAPETPGPPGFVPPANIATHLRRDSQVKTRRTLNPWLVCDHTKLFVFDQQSALIGGMNIGREYRSEWHDLMAIVEGPVVHSLSREFNRAWRRAGPWGDFGLLRAPAALRRPVPASPGDIALRVLRTDPAEGRFDILDATLLAIRGARERIWIQTPYFAHSKIAGTVQAAALRGVDVRVILPSRADSTIMDAANLAVAGDLIRAGATVWQYPRMTHMKVMICDGWATFGSANLDTLSLRINRELNLAFNDPATLRDLENRVFLPDFKVSRRLTIDDTSAPVNRLARIVADQL